MRRFATILSVACLLMTAGNALAADYGWKLSGSSTDPNANTGAAIGGTPFTVYLWLDCTNFDGMSACEFSLQTTWFNAGFTPSAALGVLNAGNSTDLLLAVGGCPMAGSIMGSWVFIDFTGLGASACLVNSPGGENGTVDCDTVDPQIHPNAVVGYSTDATPPCTLDLCTTVAVEPSTWGGLKGLYR